MVHNTKIQVEFSSGFLPFPNGFSHQIVHRKFVTLTSLSSLVCNFFFLFVNKSQENQSIHQTQALLIDSSTDHLFIWGWRKINQEVTNLYKSNKQTNPRFRYEEDDDPETLGEVSGNRERSCGGSAALGVFIGDGCK